MPEINCSRDRAVSLFRYLKEITELRIKTIRALDEYEEIVWLSDIPREKGCYCYIWPQDDDILSNDNLVKIEKPNLLSPPALPMTLKPWVSQDQVNNSSVDFPELRGQIVKTRETSNLPEDEVKRHITVNIDEHPEISRLWEEYVENDWWPWAENDRKYRSVQRIYTELFSIYQKQQRLGEMYEVILGIGLLVWKTADSQTIKRHLLTAQVNLNLDSARGAITVDIGSDGAKLALEQEMIDATDRPPVKEQQTIEKKLDDVGDNLWEKEALEKILKSWVHSVSSKGIYKDNLSAPLQLNIKNEPNIYFAPALILRKRNERNLIRVFQDIITQIQEGGKIPTGIRRLVEIVDDYSHDDSYSKTNAADEIYFPLESNVEQKEIITRLMSRHGVLVQGPPGTGKSHTIANLVCHLLASGKRVLVTSQAPRALTVLSRMIPKEIAALCVSLLGYDRAALQDLEDCVLGITDRYNHWNIDDNMQKIDNLEDSLDKARRKEAELLAELRSLREIETYEHSIVNGRYQGTLATIAKRLKEEENYYAWIGVLENTCDTPPITPDEGIGLLKILRVLNDERRAELRKRLAELSCLPAPLEFAEHVREESDAEIAFRGMEKYCTVTSYPLLLKSDVQLRKVLQEQLKEYEAGLIQFQRYPCSWVREAVSDVLLGHSSRWHALLNFTKDQLQDIEKILDQAAVAVEGIETVKREKTINDATLLLGHFKAGKGMGIGPFQPKIVRDNRYLISNVYVDGMLCDNADALEKLIQWLNVDRMFSILNERWCSFMDIKGPFRAQIPQYKDLIKHLNNIILLQEKADIMQDTLKPISGFPEPAWHNLEEIYNLQIIVRATFYEERLRQTSKRFNDYEKMLQEIVLKGDAHPVIEQLLKTIKNRDGEGYGKAFETLCGLEKDASLLRKSESILNDLRSALPAVVDRLLSTYFERVWDERFPHFVEAWEWAGASRWLGKKVDPMALDRLVVELEYFRQQIKTTMTKLVEAKAWGHFFTRLEEEQRQHLMAWTYSMRNIGKGTGKYAPQHRRDARAHMERCRPAIPAWIMPIFRVAESIRPGVDAFDVVIVDEASQSGQEALFLQYLAPKIIVVGDDKQISPENVGINREEVNVLRDRHINSLPLNDMYSLENSFFDQAATRFGGRIRLTEHFRCMPEIIQFSNNICYRAEPLIPLRQRNTERLEPIKVTHITDGYRRGAGSRVENPPEAETIVEQIIKCTLDPVYQGKTMGVISLQGEGQARLIESMLLEQLGSEEMVKRQLVCGDAYAFQGDERDIIFLSMVAAPYEGRIGTLSGSRYQRRFNVAASRAKDQMWLFHTATLNDFSKVCYRYKLLQYCLEPRLDSVVFEDEVLDPDILTQPFESLFEQHVYCKIKEKGYRVVPQYNVAGYRIDLVVFGARGQLAVECDGDRWHGPEQYEADMNRQRQLERCGWTFWRVRASTFYRSPDKAMETLWRKLGGLEIHPLPEEQDKKPSEVTIDNEKEKSTMQEEININTVRQPINKLKGKVIPLDRHRETGISEDHPKSIQFQNIDVKKYVCWNLRPLLDPRETTIHEVMRGLLDIIEIEGPIFISRVFQLYLKGAGIGRRGGYLERILFSALQLAIDKGAIIENNELGTKDKLARIVRINNMPKVLLRTKGERVLGEIPPLEILGIMSMLLNHKKANIDDKELLFRMVLDFYGFKRMTKNTRQILTTALEILLQQQNKQLGN